jgi:tetratricopeptide (TPR) repeat protein
MFASRKLKSLVTFARPLVLIAILGWITRVAAPASAQTNAAIRIVEVGLPPVEILQPGTSDWTLAASNQILKALYRVRTGTNSSVGILWSDNSMLRFGPLTELEIRPSDTDDASYGLHLFKGLLSFFHRGQPGRINIITSGGLAGIEGTEFVMEVAASNGVEQTTLSVIDGKVRFTNQVAGLVLTNGEQAVAQPGKAPVRTAGFIANNVLQWCFYYPGILDLKDLPLTDKEKVELDGSLAAYRDGDLLAALAKYPAKQQPGSDAERVYHAALLLSAGRVAEAETGLAAMAAKGLSERNQRLARALRTLIAAVKREPSAAVSGQLPTECLAASYFEQSRAIPDVSLQNALRLAREAITNSPEFGFGWERVAELEFSFGRTGHALAALSNALRLSPRNAQALALQGFLLAAQNKTPEAIEWFNRALSIDSALDNAWLGRGLCRIRRGDLHGGVEDLLVAAAMEPQRAGLRNYLAKGWSQSGDERRAFKELQRAKTLDPHDPTAWLYSALLNEDENRINEAIRDLEKSEELNDNRAVYRSKLLLDQDTGVRSANLARIYDEAGLSDVAVREASRAVTADYENYSAHLFLANSYQQLFDESPYDLRYETPAFSEYLIASLLGPADGRILAQPVTQQEYTSLFERDTLGFSSSTEYLSRGAWHQYAAQYGTLRDSSYAIETDYNSDPGQTPNGSVETLQLSLKIKEMLTPKDSLFVQVLDFHQISGDLSQRYDPSQADTGLNVNEKQEPSALVGLDHKWSETQRTLFLASIFNDTLSLTDSNGGTYLLGSASSNSPPATFAPLTLNENFENRLTVESFEVQHLANFSQFQTIAGIRLQLGIDRLANQQSWLLNNLEHNMEDVQYFPDEPANITNQSLRAYSLRITPYLYQYWQIAPHLSLIGGLAYDYQSLPQNALFAPLGNGDKIERQISPKGGLVWQPAPDSAVRAAYTQSLGGANLDQSLRLEPTQLAGFTQAYRTLMPASLVGGVDGERFETGDVSLERRFGYSTYLALAGEWLHSTANQSVGGFSRAAATGEGPAIQLSEQLAYQELSADFSAHQLIGDYFSVSARYRLADAQLSTSFPQLDPTLGNTRSDMLGLLHLVALAASFNHPCGFFASVEGQWWRQELAEDLSSVPGDQFWQANIEVGYRSPRRRVEVSLGVLNITGQDYNLYPINLYPDLPRQRTFATRLQLNF